MAEEKITQEQEQEQKGMTIAEEIAAVIDAKYSIDTQIAIIRQKDTKPEDYEEFYNFAEEVKRKVKESRKDDPPEEEDD